MPELRDQNDDSADSQDEGAQGDELQGESSIDDSAERFADSEGDDQEVLQGEVLGGTVADEAEEYIATQLAGGSPEQVAELTGDLQRLTAEYANYRRRTAREREAVIATAKAQVYTQLLPIADDLDLADKHGDLGEGPLKAFAGKFRGLLETNDVEAFGVPGDVFDAEIHEAVQDEGGDGEKVISSVLRKGYRRDGRLLRTAMVTVRGDG